MDAKAFATTVRHLEASKYMQVAAATLLIYDYLLTLEKERRYFWNGRITWGNLLFFANRYIAIVAICVNMAALLSPLVNDAVGSGFIILSRVLIQGAAEIFTVQAILIGRIQAMYMGDRRIMIPLIALYIPCAISSVVVVSVSVWSVEIHANPTPGIIACAVNSLPTHLYAFWIPVLVIESVLFGLAMFKTIQYIYTTPFKKTRSKTVQFFEVIMRDSIIYFAVVLSLYMATAFIWRFAPADLFDVLYDMVVALISIICSRMMINLREIGAGGQAMATATDYELPGNKTHQDFHPQNVHDMELHDINPLASYNLNESRMYFSA